MKRKIVLSCQAGLLALIVGGTAGVVSAQTREEQAVAAVLMGEAWSEGVEGMTAVAEVIYQRSSEKGRTPFRTVAGHRGRAHTFSCVNGTTLDNLIRKFRRQPAFGDALKLAQVVCETPEKLPGITHAANHYTVLTERPFWVGGHEPVAVIGRHAFYRLSQY